MRTLKESLLDIDSNLKNDDMIFMIEAWLDFKHIGHYNINKDYSIDLEWDLMLDDCDFTELPSYINFNKVQGNCSCRKCINLRSLRGMPRKVDGYFSCSRCKELKSLEGSPEFVHGDFLCCSCWGLRDLKGSPETIYGDFVCAGCKELESLKGAPKYIRGLFECTNCPNLKSLEYAPKCKNIISDIS